MIRGDGAGQISAKSGEETPASGSVTKTHITSIFGEFKTTRGSMIREEATPNSLQKKIQTLFMFTFIKNVVAK